MPVKVESTPALPGLSPVGGKAIVARFDAACMSSDGGLLALRAAWRPASMIRVIRAEWSMVWMRSSAPVC
jgi:hypothetical protein